MILTFSDFKRGRGGAMAEAVFGVDLSTCHSWDNFQSEFIRANGQDGSMIARAREVYGVLSKGERVLRCAILYACDFARQADELSGLDTWKMLDDAARECRAVVAACLLRQDAFE